MVSKALKQGPELAADFAQSYVESCECFEHPCRAGVCLEAAEQKMRLSGTSPVGGHEQLLPVQPLR